MITTRPVAERLAEAGLPYRLESADHFWSVFSPGNVNVPVLAFTEDGVFVGYHGDEAEQVAKKVRRMRGVQRVVIPTTTLDI